MNVKDVALVPPDDSTMQVAVKASFDDQFATLAASIFAGRNWSATPFGSAEELLDSLGDLIVNRTPATAATRFGSRIAGGGAAAGFTRRGSVFTIVDQEDKLELDNAWHWQDEEEEYEHIMTILDIQGVFGQTYSDPAFYVRFLRLKGDAQHARTSLENALTAVKMLISLDAARSPSRMYQLRSTPMLDLATQLKQTKIGEHGRQD